MSKTDVLGYILEDARSYLESSGYKVAVVLTRPPGGNPQGNLRVVNVAVTADTVTLTVAREEEGKGGVLNGL